MIDPTLSDVEAYAVENLRLARRHARSLERLAVAWLILGGVIAAVALIAVELALGVVLMGGAVLGWALLRASALRLHLDVDRALLEG